MKKNKGVLITSIIFGVIFAIFAFFAIALAFDMDAIVELEHEIIHTLEWSKFNLLTISIIGCVVCVIVIVAVLVASDDKAKKTQQRQRRQSTMFK